MWNLASCSELERQELIDAIADGIAFVKGSTDRIRNIWALKIIAENVARIDELDRRDGTLPVQTRPALMISWREAGLLLDAVRDYAGTKDRAAGTDTAVLMKKLRGYLQ